MRRTKLRPSNSKWPESLPEARPSWSPSSDSSHSSLISSGILTCLGNQSGIIYLQPE